jgi:hypothetical protein
MHRGRGRAVYREDRRGRKERHRLERQHAAKPDKLDDRCSSKGILEGGGRREEKRRRGRKTGERGTEKKNISPRRRRKRKFVKNRD